jgi:hypothetical protein
MGWPGAYPQVISAGSAGWIGEWLKPTDGLRYRMWWLQYPDPPLLPGSGDVADPTSVDDVYVSDFSSRNFPGNSSTCGARVVGARSFPGDPGFAHLPWYSGGIGDLVGGIRELLLRGRNEHVGAARLQRGGHALEGDSS